MTQEFATKTLFFDGAFGTYYTEIGGNQEFCELANLYDPETVVKIHREYIRAGAQAIKTNTFGINSALSTEQERLREILEAGWALANEAAEPYSGKVAVYADIGCASQCEEPDKEYLNIVQLFLEKRATNFLFETMPELTPLLPAIGAIRKQCKDANIMVSFAVSQDGYTTSGLYYKELIEAAAKNPDIDATGLNCICGPSHLFRLLKNLDRESLGSLCAMPNAGYPANVNGRTVFRNNAGYFSDKLTDIFYALDIGIVGGCCGTTPEHIRMSIEKINGTNSIKQQKPSFPLKNELQIQENSFKNKLMERKKVVAVELDPPVGTDCQFVLEAADKAGTCGADIITLSDSPLARTRADSIMTAAKIRRETGLDVLPHLSCRDKNHIGIKGALLGASMEGIQNILVVTGDPIMHTERREYKGVFSFNSFKLISYIDTLNSEVFSRQAFYIGGALNVNTLNFAHELERAKTKLKNGAGFFLTQPIFDDNGIENLQRAREELPCKILAGIMPVASYKNALFLNNEVSGIEVPDSLLESLEGKSAADVLEISAAFSMEIIHKIAPLCDGYYLMTPLKKIDLICRLIQEIRSM